MNIDTRPSQKTLPVNKKYVLVNVSNPRPKRSVTLFDAYTESINRLQNYAIWTQHNKCNYTIM